MADQLNKKSDHQLRMPEPWTSKTTSSNGLSLPPLGPPPPPPPPPPSFQIWKKIYGGEGGSGSKSPVSQSPLDGLSIFKTEDQEAFEKNMTEMEARYMAMQGDAIQGIEIRKGREPNLNVDPERIKRVFANRISAQKSRMRKLQYMTYMENRVKDLQTMITKLSPQIMSLTKQKEKLQLEKQFMSQQLNAQNETKKLKEAEIALNRAEVKRLRELHFNQQQTQALQLASLNMIQSVGQQHFGYLNSNQGNQLAPQQMPNPYVQQQGNNNMEEMMNGDSFSSIGSRNFI
ncbi:bZIP transcription factor 18-like [Tripterygium wilfordii]|uniref:bZIP transcription factor 18-like n=1 Tax=Tripterygium wilfordii TaxID=458696 RepID=UPI0018F8614B|nr:bZIP transcription factor 18-like [Tripterygium wilfordii]